MKYRTSILIDRVFGAPVLLVLNPLARLLGWTMRRRHALGPEEVRSIVVSKYVGIGSLVQAMPMLAALKRSYPDATLTLLTSSDCATFARRLGQVDRVLVVRRSGIFGTAFSSLGAVFKLWGARPQLFIDIEVYSLYASIMSVLSCARNRYGFYRRSTWLKSGALTHLLYFNSHQPVSEIYLEMARLAGAKTDGESPQLDAPPVGEVEALGAAGLQEGQYLVVNVNASDLMKERRWPLEKFGRLITMLAADGHRVVLTGTASEAPYVAGVLGHIEEAQRGNVTDLSGKLDLEGFLSVLRGARCVITNDSGPMHLAFRLGARVVTLFGPGDPVHYGYDHERFTVVRKPVYCSPCVYETSRPPCGGDNICMQQIEVQEVYDAAQVYVGEVVGSA
ncbi:MAG: glycosyltransferase family 9 protein [Planctomycetes bacterium]|nr:glycosyltransferase family 9 protein [Planctomycetota bacterium]